MNDIAIFMDKTLNPKIDEMWKKGAHFGYSKTRRHPSTAPYIFSTKNKNDIINLEKTLESLDKALEFTKDLAPMSKVILFVGSKPEAKEIIKNAASALDMPYVAERWIGGTLTNFTEIKKRIARLEDLRAKKEAGELEVYTKKERLLLDRETDKLNLYFGGLTSLKKAPDAIFLIDPKKEKIAYTEAKKAGVPVIALSNSDCDIKGIDYPIVANDASVTSINFFVQAITDAYKEGKMTVATVS